MTKKELIQALDKLPDNTIITVAIDGVSFFIEQAMEDSSVDKSVYAPELILFVELDK